MEDKLVGNLPIENKGRVIALEEGFMAKYELSAAQVQQIVGLLNNVRMTQEETEKVRIPILKSLQNPVKEEKKK